MLYHGEPVTLGGRAFDILTLLVRRAGEVVSKAELFAHVWPGYLVHDHNLKVNVGNLRRILAAYDPATEYVATIAGRGYTFVAALGPVGEAVPLSATVIGRGRMAPPPKAPLLYGRADAVRQIAAMAHHGGYVTLVGPGGAGKTATAINAAQHCCDNGQEIAFVDLSTLSDPQFVVPAMAAAMGVSLGLDDPLGGVIDRLRVERPLLIIDNCEHVIATAAAMVERLSSMVPDAVMIATSREPLRTRHEQVCHLAGLSFPDPVLPMSLDEIRRFPAVQLFLAKAGLGDAAAIDEGYVRSVAAICARLDGLALAIELAAGTAGSFPSAALDTLFSEGFGGMRRGPRDAPLRHQTLDATLDWSYRLLPDNEARLFALLSVFAGRFSADDVESIYAAGKLDPVAGRDALAQLVAKSLVVANLIRGSLSYRLVESSWVYASQRLIGAPDLERVKRHFALRVLARMHQAERDWSFLASQEWLGRYADQLDDLRAAINWAFGPDGDARTGFDLVVAALPLWQELSAFEEMLAAIDQALHAEGGGALSSLGRVRLHMAQAWAMTLRRQIHARAGEVWRETLRYAQAAGHKDLELQAVCGEAVYLAYSGRPGTALRSMLEYAAVARVDWAAAPGGMRFLAHDEIYAGKLASADTRLRHLRQACGESADEPGLSRFQVDLPVAINLSSALLLWLQGQGDGATALADRAIARATALDHMISLGNAICLAGLPLAFLDGDLARADHLQRRLAEVARRESVGIYEGTARFFAGAIAAAQGGSAGIELMAASIDALWQNGWRLRSSLYRSLLADACLRVGDAGRAANVMRSILSIREVREERWCHGELWRVAGLVAAHEGDRVRAGRCFRRGLLRSRLIGAAAFSRRIGHAMAAAGMAAA